MSGGVNDVIGWLHQEHLLNNSVTQVGLKGKWMHQHLPVSISSFIFLSLSSLRAFKTDLYAEWSQSENYVGAYPLYSEGRLFSPVVPVGSPKSLCTRLILFSGVAVTLWTCLFS